MNAANQHPDESLIHDFVDDELSGDERGRVAAHLAGCPPCRETADALVELREHARRTFARAPEIDATDRWGGIEAAIDGRLRARRLSPLAAAASVVLLLGSGALYLSLRGPEVVDTPTAVAVAAEPAPASAIAAAYAPTLAEFERILAAERDLLEPETVATVEASLAILNQAIRDIEAALAADPAHRSNLKSLETMYQTKLGVLQQVVTLTTGA
jgi:anti-sigma factor RsiW